MIIFLISDLTVRGGTHKQLLKLVQYADDNQIDFKIVTSKIDLNSTYPYFKKFKNKIKVIEPQESKWYLGKIINYFKYFKLLKVAINEAEMINIHDGGFEKYLGAFKGKKVYWQINDLHSCFNEGVANSKVMTIKSKLLKIYILSKKHLITEFTVNVSKNAERIKKHFNRNAKVFYCGIEPLGFMKDNSLSFQRFSNKQINLLSSGVFFPYRNYETQIEVVKILRKNGIDVNLNIFGSTMLDINYSEKIKNKIIEENLNDYISILGQIDEETYFTLHKNSDLFLFVNLDQSWGLAIFEAMSCGLPVIVSESVGATEILHNGVDSIFVCPTNESEIANEIIKVMNDTTYYEKIAKKANKFHENFSWDSSYCSKMLNLMGYTDVSKDHITLN